MQNMAGNSRLCTQETDLRRNQPRPDLDLGLQPSDCEKINVYCLSHGVCGALNVKGMSFSC